MASFMAPGVDREAIFVQSDRMGRSFSIDLENARRPGNASRTFSAKQMQNE